MSYILDALNKGDSNRKPSDNVQRNNHGQRDNVDEQASIVQPTIAIQSSSNYTLLWGLLLTAAIFLALVAGYWVGTKQSVGRDTSMSVAEQASSTTTKLANQPDSSPVNGQSQNQTSVQQSYVANSDAINNSKVKLAAEDYFERPPRKVVSSEQTKSAEAPAVKEQAPLILGDPRPYQQAQANKVNDEFKVKAEEGVSADLLARFQSAIDETAVVSSEPESDQTQEPKVVTTKIHDLPVVTQNALPSMDFEMHIFSSEGSSWVKLNGKELNAGEWYNNDLQLVDILPQTVVMSYQGQHFSMPALSSWQN
ncbi:general secretion pathway protein GspB [Endozoicomonas sp. G2_1]|uniref:general secretion pathway protein GspB n=1 Tax=Endozoicomonas sp. G2_1 TaxID=2821091 RepID=UPI001ADAF73A|nr:general secretion pathway protein GspB [Endozoicomonas sp. G2_1]MBO9489357.1 general secretion pathway protein GspB [Endozoicomonas sp. G2_1]